MTRPKLALVGPVTWRGASESSDLQLGLLSLAAVLRQHGYAVALVDLNRLPGRNLEAAAIDSILATGPDLVGFGSICSSYPQTLRLAHALKRARSSLTLILGGPQASVVDRQTLLAFPAVDFILRGEADESLPALLAALEQGAARNQIAGLTYRQSRQICRNPNAAPMADLDQLPLPAYDLYEGLDRRSWLPLEAGRGCPFACRFCSTNDFFRRRFRLKSPHVLADQMSLLARRYGVRDFQLTHDMFTVDRNRVAAFCEELIGRGESLRWRCSARTDCVDEELLALMARAGCTGMFFGIETGSQRLQAVIDKNLDLAESRRVLQAADRLNVETTASLITGYPEETLRDLDETVGFFGEAIRLDRCDPQLHLLSPLAETPLESQYRDRLVYDPIASDISGDAEQLDAGDALLIQTHPDIFPNFYALPCPIERAYLRDLRAFLLALAQRSKGLLLALHIEAGGLRQVFDLWRADPSAARSDYQSWEFFREFLRFTSTLGHPGLHGVTLLSRFYGALAAQPDRPVQAERRKLIHLRDGVQLVTLEGDVVGALSCLHAGLKIEDSQLLGRRTYAVQHAGGRRNAIRELSPLSAAILERCATPMSRSGLTDALTAGGITVGRLLPSQFLGHALQVLADQGLLATPQ
jgi:radical SAM superfamily enzyme YgiQ (UPF0313 family)